MSGGTGSKPGGVVRVACDTVEDRLLRLANRTETRATGIAQEMRRVSGGLAGPERSLRAALTSSTESNSDVYVPSTITRRWLTSVNVETFKRFGDLPKIHPSLGRLVNQTTGLQRDLRRLFRTRWQIVVADLPTPGFVLSTGKPPMIFMTREMIGEGDLAPYLMLDSLGQGVQNAIRIQRRDMFEPRPPLPDESFADYRKINLLSMYREIGEARMAGADALFEACLYKGAKDIDDRIRATDRQGVADTLKRNYSPREVDILMDRRSGKIERGVAVDMIGIISCTRQDGITEGVSFHDEFLHEIQERYFGVLELL